MLRAFEATSTAAAWVLLLSLLIARALDVV
jgi:hypothetical protein